MKINDIQSLEEGKSSVVSKAERGEKAAGAERGLSRAERERAAFNKAAGRDVPKTNASNAPTKGNATGEVPGKKPDTKQAEPNDAPKGGTGPEGSRVPPQVQAQMDKAAAGEKAAADALPKKGKLQSDDAYLKSLTPDQLERVTKIRQAKQATGIQNDKNIVDKFKERPVANTLKGAAVVGGTAYIGSKAIDKAQDVAKKDAALDAKADSSGQPAAAPAAPAAANDDGTINNPSKNSPYFVPADNDTRQSKPYPAGSPYADASNAPADNDSRQSKPYPEVARPAAGAATGTGYKGSQGSQAIQALNPDVADVNKIRTGQQLKMPDGSTYTVQKGDALDRIARHAGLSPRQAPVEKPAAPVASAPEAPAAPTVSTVPPASVDTRDGTGDNDKEAVPTRDYSSGRPVDKELDDKYGTSNTRTDAEGRTYVRQKSAMGGPDTENRSYASFGDFFNKIRGKGDVNGKVADEVQENYELNSIKKLSSITESKITQVDNNMDLRKLLAIMSETKMADLKGKKHGGSYGKEYDTDEEGDDSKPAEKKSRGGQESDSTKDSKKWQGADDAADAIIGGKAPKKEVGKKSVKHSIKEWMQAVEESALQEGAKPDFLDMDKDGDKKEPMKKAVADKKNMKKKTVKEEDVSEELKGGQKKIDKNKNGKLDSEDFKMLRKNKVDEGVNLHKMMTEKQVKVDEMLEELQQEIAEFKATGEMGDKLRDALDLHSYTKGETLIGEGDQELADKFHDEDMIRLGDEGKADAQHMQDLDRTRDESTADLWRMKDLARDKTMGRADAISLREEDHAQGDTVYHRGQIGIVDRIEGNKCFVHKPNGDMDVWPTEECSKKKQGAFDMFKKDVQDVGAGFGRFLKGKSELDESPFAFESKKVKEEEQPKLKTTMTDTGSETTSNTGRIKATFQPGKETKVEPVKESFVYDVWNHQLEKMINESLTVTTTKGDNGTDDSVSVTASGSDASDIMAILRNAGVGSMGAEEEHMDHPTSAYGAPEGESVGVVQIDGPEVIDGDDTMLGLMKKIANINDGHEEGHEEHMDHGSSEDYEDENCEQEVEEGNAFTGALKDTPQGGEFEVDGKKYTDNSSLEEGNATCNECGMNEGECEHTKMVEGADNESAEVGLEEDADGAEYANSDDNAELQDIKFMTNYITGGLNGQKTMHRHGYQNADNPLAMRESADPLAQWKKLSGLS